MAIIKISAKDAIESGGHCCMGVKVFYNGQRLERIVSVNEKKGRLFLEFDIKETKTIKDYEIEFEV